MPSKTSFFNRGIFFNNIKRFWLITFSYTFFLFLYIVGYLNSAINRLENISDLDGLNQIGPNIFSQSNDVMVVFLGFYSLIAALAVFSYMQFPRNTAMVHSLPVRRETLFVTNYLSGLFIVTFPILFNSLIVFVVGSVSGFPSLIYPLLWLGVNMVLTFLLYSFSVFASMFTGHMGAHAIFFLIFNFLAFFLEAMINIVLNDFLFGYSSSSTRFDAWSPLYYIMDLFSGFASGEGDVTAVVGYLIAGVIFLVSAYFLYKKRHMEVATDVISFQVVKPIFKYSVAFCSSALLGSILVSVLDIRQELIPYILTYLFGGLIGYFSSEMLLRKTFRVFKAYKGFVVFGVVLSLLLCSINFDFFGYERYIPKDSEVELMHVSPYIDSRAKLALMPEDYNPEKHGNMLFNSSDFINNPPAKLTDAQIKELRNQTQIIESREAITKARLIHDYIVEHEAFFKENEKASSNIPQRTNTDSQNDYPSRSLYFGYRLHDGTIVERSYRLMVQKNNSELDLLLRDYLSVPNIMEKYEPILQETASDIRSIMINYTYKDGVTRSYEIEDIQGFLAAYQKDILAQDPLESMYRNYEGPYYNISVYFEQKDINFQNYGPNYSQSLSPKHENSMDYLIQNKIIDLEQLEKSEFEGKLKY